VTAHSLWYEPKVDLCIVPTKQAEQRALENNLPRGKVRVVGLPVAQRFCDPIGDPGSLRATLDWPQALPVVLLVGGGEGMGPLEETAEKISELDAEFALAIVTGRNTTLKRKLEARSWPIQTMVYGFERRMPEMMRAATLLVTKAGPGTITEALNAGLPMVLYSHLPGQETGNIDYVVEAGVGLWAPGPQRTAEAVRWWLWNQEVLQAAGEACLRMARPEAAMEIADIIAEQAHQPRAAQYSNSAGTHGRDESSA
jgi:1,2-diacylglycerol 3-beta-galactosyltransferase